MNLSSVRILCDYIFQKEKDDFIQQVINCYDEGKITIDEREDLLAFVESHDVHPSQSVRQTLQKINHVYSHAVLSYSDIYK